MTPPKIGFVAPGRAADVAALEDAGVDSFWVGGHVASPNPTPEPMVWLARLVEQTRRARVGTATLLLPLHPPPVVAKQIADLDRASGGRVVLGVGVGGEYRSDFEAAGVPVGERGARADEAIGLLRRFWTAEPVDHDGDHFRYAGLRIHPAPAQPGGPPIVVTGRKAPAMRRAARLGDGWMPYLYSAARYAESVDRIRDLANRAERSLAGFRWSVYVMVAMSDDGEAARRSAAAFLGGTYRQDFDAFLDRVAVAGSPDDVGERLQAFLDAGADELVLCPMGGDGLDLSFRLVRDLAPRLSVPRRS